MVGLNSDEKNPFATAQFEQSFEQQFWALSNGEPVFCAQRQKQLASLKRPDALLVDVSNEPERVTYCNNDIRWQIFGYKLLQIARCISPDTKVWASGPSLVISLYTIFGPFGSDSHGFLQRLVAEHMAATGQDLMSAALEVSFDS